MNQPAQTASLAASRASRAPRVPPILGIAIGVAAISTASIFIRLAQMERAPSLTIAALRLVFASLALLPFAWARCRAELAALSARDLLVGLLSGAFLGAHFATWVSSLQYTSVTSSVVLVTLSPLLVAVASALFLKEKLTRLALVGVIVAVSGGVLLSAGDAGGATLQAPNPPLGNALAFLGALCIVPHFLIGRRLRVRLSLLAYISLVYSAAALVLLLAVWVTATPLGGFDPQAYLWMALLALLPQLVGHTSFNWSLGFLPATFATIPALGEPIGSTILAIILFGDVLTPLRLFSAVLTLGGIALMMVSRTINSKQAG